MSNAHNPSVFPYGWLQDDSNGIALRDWFAGQALPAVIAATSAGLHHPGQPGDRRPMAARIAEDAYGLADAMLAERAK